MMRQKSIEGSGDYNGYWICTIDTKHDGLKNVSPFKIWLFFGVSLYVKFRGSLPQKKQKDVGNCFSCLEGGELRWLENPQG